MKKKGKPVSKNRAIATRPKRPTDLLARAGVKKGYDITTSKNYFQPVMPIDRVLWSVKRDKQGNVLSTKPFAPYDMLVDNLHRRGVVSVITDELPTVKCSERGCDNAKDDAHSVQHRFKATVTLENGQIFVGYGEACRHNTTRLSRKSCPRVAETRSKARALRDATNIGITCIVELPDFQGGWTQGKNELSNQDIEEQGSPEAKAAPHSNLSGMRKALPAGTSTQTAAAPTADGDKSKAMKELHAVAHDQKVNVVGLHAWIHRKENVASLTKMSAEQLKRWADKLRALGGEELATFQQNCVAAASGGEVQS